MSSCSKFLLCINYSQDPTQSSGNLFFERVHRHDWGVFVVRIHFPLLCPLHFWEERLYTKLLSVYLKISKKIALDLGYPEHWFSYIDTVWTCYIDTVWTCYNRGILSPQVLFSVFWEHLLFTCVWFFSGSQQQLTCLLTLLHANRLTFLSDSVFQQMFFTPISSKKKGKILVSATHNP